MNASGIGDADPWNLERFVRAQQGVYPAALAELRRGRKTTHWMWFVFPQLRGLGHSPTAVHFGISGGPEAIAYRAHPVLGPRLLEASAAAAAAPARDVDSLLGAVDAQKLQSSMTLFCLTSADSAPFSAVLERWFDGNLDANTQHRLDM